MNGGMDGTVADHPAYRTHRAVKEKEKDGWRDRKKDPLPLRPTCRKGEGEGRSEGWIRIGSKEKRIRIGWSLPSREGFVALS